jgi:hypothetical protein
VRCLALTALLLLCAIPAEAKGPDHAGAAAGGVVSGLVCGGGTLLYARARAGGHASADDPMLWHQAEGPGILGAFFAEHALVGGLTGAFGDGPRGGFLIGGAVTCTLDIGWIVASEILASQQEPGPGGTALLERSDGSWRLSPPPVVIRRDGAWVSLLSVRF